MDDEFFCLFGDWIVFILLSCVLYNVVLKCWILFVVEVVGYCLLNMNILKFNVFENLFVMGYLIIILVFLN